MCRLEDVVPNKVHVASSRNLKWWLGHTCVRQVDVRNLVEGGGEDPEIMSLLSRETHAQNSGLNPGIHDWMAAPNGWANEIMNNAAGC